MCLAPLHDWKNHFLSTHAFPTDASPSLQSTLSTAMHILFMIPAVSLSWSLNTKRRRKDLGTCVSLQELRNPVDPLLAHLTLLLPNNCLKECDTPERKPSK